MAGGDTDDLTDFLSKEAKDPAAPLLRAGDVVGSWRIISFLGGGGFGEVYRAEHTGVGIVCALKLLRRNSESAKVRFEREAAYVARSSRSGVPRFYEVGEKDGRPYFVMEMLTPRELPSTDRKVAALLKELCQIVSALHGDGFVHRDIKPSNVLYRGNGDVVLVDYGLLKAASKGGLQTVLQDALTQSNAAVGTERYAAPEQLAGSPIDCHADIHALGVLIDACFHGRLPRRWRRIVCRATSSLAERRYPSCVALSRAIAWRFAGEIAVALSALAVIATVALTIAFAPEFIRHPDTAVLPAASTNAEHSANGKNVSDGAEDWLSP